MLDKIILCLKNKKIEKQKDPTKLELDVLNFIMSKYSEINFNCKFKKVSRRNLMHVETKSSFETFFRLQKN